MTDTEDLVKAEFIEDVGKYMVDKQPEAAILELQERLQRYKMLESQVLARKARLMSKLPEIQKALDIVNVLIDKQDSDDVLTADYELNDGVYAQAHLQGVTSVNLWLGAGVMVEYPLPEARQVLTTNLANCKANLETVKGDLELIKGSVTTTEVSVARVFNWDVERRRRLKQAGIALA